MISLISCRESPSSTSKSTIVIQPKIEIFDTIVIDNYAENANREIFEMSFTKLTNSEIIDTLSSFSLRQGITEFNDNEFPSDNGTNQEIFYTHNIPRSIYKRIFPKEIIKVDKIRSTNAIIDENTKKVIIEKGPKFTEERQYKSLISIVEKKNYIQLAFTIHGKYSPDVELFTVSREDFSKIDFISLFGGIYDSYDIDFCYSKFTSNYEEIVRTRIINTNYDKIKLDTIITKYKISKFGKIIKQENE